MYLFRIFWPQVLTCRLEHNKVIRIQISFLILSCGSVVASSCGYVVASSCGSVVVSSCGYIVAI